MFGWNQWDRVRKAIYMNPILQNDYYLRTRSDNELSKRAEIVLKAAKREQSEQRPIREKFRTIHASHIERLERDVEQAKQQERDVEAQLECLKAKYNSLLEKIQTQQEAMMRDASASSSSVTSYLDMETNVKLQEGEVNSPLTTVLSGVESEALQPTRLGMLKLPASTIVSLLPLLYELKRGMTGSIQEIVTYFRHFLPSMKVRTISSVVSVVTERRLLLNGMYFLRSSLIDFDRQMVDLSKEMEVTEEIRQSCQALREKEEQLERENEGKAPSVNVKAIVKEWKEKETKWKERLVELLTPLCPISLDQLKSDEMLQKLEISKEELGMVKDRVLKQDPVSLLNCDYCVENQIICHTRVTRQETQGKCR